MVAPAGDADASGRPGASFRTPIRDRAVARSYPTHSELNPSAAHRAMTQTTTRAAHPPPQTADPVPASRSRHRCGDRLPEGAPTRPTWPCRCTTSPPAGRGESPQLALAPVSGTSAAGTSLVGVVHHGAFVGIPSANALSWAVTSIVVVLGQGCIERSAHSTRSTRSPKSDARGPQMSGLLVSRTPEGPCRPAWCTARSSPQCNSPLPPLRSELMAAA